VRERSSEARRIAVFAGVIAAVLALCSVTFDGGGPITITWGASGCPTRYLGQGLRSWVPAIPQGVDGTRRLVPRRPPSAAVVCAYLQRDGGALTGARPLRHRDALTAALTYLPSFGSATAYSCFTYLDGEDDDNFLIKLTYPDGELWVSTPHESCPGVPTNGVFASRTSIGADTDTAFQFGAWPVRPSAPTCSSRFAGRLGDDVRMVPGHPVSVTVCWPDSDGTQRTVTSSNTAALISALNRLPTKPYFDRPCSADADQPPSIALNFHYESGPDVHVEVRLACQQGVVNELLESDDPVGIVPLIDILFREK
jgi:hypothetical protein